MTHEAPNAEMNAWLRATLAAKGPVETASVVTKTDGLVYEDGVLKFDNLVLGADGRPVFDEAGEPRILRGSADGGARGGMPGLVDPNAWLRGEGGSGIDESTGTRATWSRITIE